MRGGGDAQMNFHFDSKFTACEFSHFVGDLGSRAKVITEICISDTENWGNAGSSHSQLARTFAPKIAVSRHRLRCPAERLIVSAQPCTRRDVFYFSESTSLWQFPLQASIISKSIQFWRRGTFPSERRRLSWVNMSRFWRDDSQDMFMQSRDMNILTALDAVNEFWHGSSQSAARF